MKFLCQGLISMLLLGCAGLDTENRSDAEDKKARADKARLEAQRIGSSEPIYELYVGCLNTFWKKALDSGVDKHQAYQAGIDQCAYELKTLCDYYATESCYADTELSNRLLFSEIESP